MVVGLPEKAIQKVDKELLELHKEVLKSYLTQRNLKHKYQKKLHFGGEYKKILLSSC